MYIWDGLGHFAVFKVFFFQQNLTEVRLGYIGLGRIEMAGMVYGY